METNYMQKLTLVYAAIIAFLLGTIGNIVGEKILSFSNTWIFLAVAFLFLLSYYLVKEISKFLGVEKPGESTENEKQPADDPYKVSKELYEKLKESRGGESPYLKFEVDRPLKKLIFPQNFVWYILTLLWFMAIARFSPSGEHPSLMIFLFPFFFWAVNFANIRDRIQMWFGNKLKVKIYFLVEGRSFLDPNEYHLVIDYGAKKFFFAFYHKSNEVETEYRAIIQEIIDNN